MAAPWVILRRVVRVGFDPGDVEAEEELQAGKAAAEEAEVGQPVPAEEEELLAGQAAIPETEVRHVPPVAAEDAVAVDEQAQHAAAAAHPVIKLSVAMPPRISILAARRGAYPDRENPDEHPFVIAAGPLYLVVNLAAARLAPPNLVLVRDFISVEGQTTASAEPLPDRSDRVPNLSSIGNVILHSTNSAAGYMIAELQIDKGSERATLVYHQSGGDGWIVKHLANPLPADDREWIPHGGASADGKLWWFDLSWGIVSYDTSPSLLFHDLSSSRSLAEATPDIHTKRCITASRNKLRYVEIIAGGEPAKVCMWTRINGDEGWKWYMKFAMSFEKIWDDDTYKETGLPRHVPMVAVMSPSDPDLVYFALEQRLIGINVPAHIVVHNEASQQVPGKLRPLSSSYILAWELPVNVCPADKIEGGELGHASKARAQGLVQERAAASSSATAGRLLRDICFGTVPEALLTSEEDDCTKPTIADIWNDGVEDAFEEMQVALEAGSSWYIGMDTEFCQDGRSYGSLPLWHKPQSEEGHYEQACSIVNEGDLVQVGLVLSDADFTIVADKIYQFNLSFDPCGRNRNSRNVEFLRTQSKLNLAQHASRGIPLHYFFRKLLESGLLYNPSITWITFQGYSDYGYLIRGVQKIAGLPQDRREFMGLIQKYFPRNYDLKVFHELGILCTKPSGNKGIHKFQAMATGLGVMRVGEAHGAGSDAHLTLVRFRQMMLSDPIAATTLGQYQNHVYGVAEMRPLPPGGLDAAEVHVWNGNFDTQVKLFTALFGTYSAVGVEVRLENGFNLGRRSSYGVARRERALSGVWTC